ncbi:hypothetical protein, partial [Lentimonas sp. CC11]|uniref:hypothetical protein n=1 Tax=Lentimonas sp. CC11 TaxID=2676096 RepID=UPI001A7EA6F5
IRARSSLRGHSPKALTLGTAESQSIRRTVWLFTPIDVEINSCRHPRKRLRLTRFLFTSSSYADAVRNSTVIAYQYAFDQLHF